MSNVLQAGWAELRGARWDAARTLFEEAKSQDETPEAQRASVHIGSTCSEGTRQARLAWPRSSLPISSTSAAPRR